MCVDKWTLDLSHFGTDCTKTIWQESWQSRNITRAVVGCVKLCWSMLSMLNFSDLTGRWMANVLLWFWLSYLVEHTTCNWLIGWHSMCVLLQKLSHSLQRPMRIVGWYHSHPHITVWPSHIGRSTSGFIL